MRKKRGAIERARGLLIRRSGVRAPVGPLFSGTFGGPQVIETHGAPLEPISTGTKTEHLSVRRWRPLTAAAPLQAHA